jgi:hypothetical protein
MLRLLLAALLLIAGICQVARGQAQVSGRTACSPLGARPAEGREVAQ